MGEERRSAARACISDIRVIYESADGFRVEAKAFDIGRGGLFILAQKPLPVGKRIALELQVQGVVAPSSALGRVVWMRDKADGAEHPAGMGVKLIDVEDDVLAVIDDLVSRARRSAPMHESEGRREPSVVIDLVAKKETSALYGPFPRHPFDPPPRPPRRGRWLLVFLFLVAVAAAAYALSGDFGRPLGFRNRNRCSLHQRPDRSPLPRA